MQNSLLVIWHYIQKFGYSILGIFSPRSGLVPATIELQRSIADARAKNAKTGHRYYCIWNASTRHLTELTYDGYPGRTDSYQYMRHRGAFPPTSRQELKKSAFFYTASKNGALEMTKEETRQKLQILRARYYTRKRK